LNGLSFSDGYIATTNTLGEKLVPYLTFPKKVVAYSIGIKVW